MSPGVHEVEYHLGKQFFENMESQDVHDADLTVKLTVNHKMDMYYLDFVVSGEVTLICDRCLDDLHYPLEAKYSIAVKYGDDYNDDNDDLLVIPESDNTLNVAYMIYDTVELQIPMKHVHPLGKCNRAMSAILKSTAPIVPTMKMPNLRISSSMKWSRTTISLLPTTSIRAGTN